jgi:hypothetical protein
MGPARAELWLEGSAQVSPGGWSLVTCEPEQIYLAASIWRGQIPTLWKQIAIQGLLVDIRVELGACEGGGIPRPCCCLVGTLTSSFHYSTSVGTTAVDKHGPGVPACISRGWS